MFHVMINRTNVNYVTLLWWDFMNNVNQKKESIQYPRFIKLIIVDLMKKFPDIPQRIEEDYHSIKDDIPLVSVYTTRNVLVRGMLISDAFLTEEICATDEFKEYKTGKKGKQSAGESSSPHKSLKITIRQQKVVEGNKDDDDSKDMLESRSHKDKPKHVDDDDEKYDEKVDEEEGEVPDLVSQEFNAQEPKIIKELFKNYVQKEIVIDEDEVIPEDETLKLITELQDADKRVLTIFDYERMKATLNDALSNQFKNAEEYAYHLEQTTNFMENQIVWESRQEDIRHPVPRPLYGNTKEKKYILLLHKIHAEHFLEFDLEEKMNHSVKKEFKTFNEDARLIIQHWKDSWHKRVYKQNQRRVRNNLEDYFSNYRITEVFRITTDQPHGLDFMELIIVMRENDKPDSFFEADFKYLNKKDIEDLYYLCQNKKVDYRETKLMNLLITFIKSRVI
ncbi:hypothetical protein Tco_1040050 [Tanacetum coccineum]